MEQKLTLSTVMHGLMNGEYHLKNKDRVIYFNKQIKKQDEAPVEYFIIEYMRLNKINFTKMGKIFNVNPCKLKEISDRLRYEMDDPSMGQLECIWDAQQ